MKLFSHITGSVRRRRRYHCFKHRALAYRGRHGDELAFQVDADDGRTYLLWMTAHDVAVVVASSQRCREDTAAVAAEAKP